MEGLSNYEKEERPWGMFERFTLNEPSTVKIITVNPGEAFSLQSHKHRDEFWHIISGAGIVTLGEKSQQVKAGDNFWSPKGAEHQMEGGTEGVEFLEISFGEFNEDDIIRVEDRYGRA
jgi:mannose-6-phosphate isomerase-like protein (cupin superfamily)